MVQQSSEVEGGAIEVLEDILRQRDTDKQLHRGLGLKSLEVGLKMRLLETDSGGKTLEARKKMLEPVFELLPLSTYIFNVRN